MNHLINRGWVPLASGVPRIYFSGGTDSDVIDYDMTIRKNKSVTKTEVPPYGAQFRLPTEPRRKIFPRCDLCIPEVN